MTKNNMQPQIKPDNDEQPAARQSPIAANSRFMSTRLFSNILNAWKGISTQFSGKRLELSPYLHADEIEPLRLKVAACIEGKGGEVSSRARAVELATAYLGLNDEGRHKYLKLLITNFDVDHDKVRTSAEALFTDLKTERRHEVEEELRQHLTPPYLKLLTLFNALPQGVKFLVDLRSDVMRLCKEHPELNPINETLHTQLCSWFDIGFLELQKIDWNAPASLLEKLIEYEAVHRVQSWKDLHHRLGENRRCFAFFHPRMPDEPLIFVWVALVDEISGSVTALLDSEQEEVTNDEPSTAIFYSISSAQKGLAGVSLGNFLIKRVVDELKRECPSLENFATLSPAPGFSNWLISRKTDSETDLFTEEEQQTLTDALGEESQYTLDTLIENTDWLTDEKISAAMHNPLQRLLAIYIATEKRNNGTAANSVAHFHLSNGAIFERTNWLADLSDHGKSQSYGMMVNYLYDLEMIDKNHEQYIEHGEIAQSKDIEKLTGNF